MESNDKENESADVSIEKDKILETTDESIKSIKIKKKRKKSNKDKPKKDANAPKYPLTGYVRYTNERRDEVKKLFPELLVTDITRKLGEEWNTLSAEMKKPYLDAAEIDKKRYMTEKKEYQKKLKKLEKESSSKIVSKKPGKKQKNGTDSTNDKLSPSTSKTTAQQSTEKTAEEMANCSVALNKSDVVEKRPSQATQLSSIMSDNSAPSLHSTLLQVQHRNTQIPIFTEQFLDHNRKIDSELRMLRRSNNDFEQQNAVLEKHVENMKNGITRLTDETTHLSMENNRLQTYLDSLRTKLALAFETLSIPTEPMGANADNIDKYMNDLYSMEINQSNGHALLNKAKDIIRKVDLS